MRVVQKRTFREIVSRTDTGSITYRFSFDLEVTIKEGKEGFVFESEEFGIFSDAGSKGQAGRSFKDEFGHLYEKLFDLDDSKLSSKMLVVKNKLNQMVTSREVWP